MTRLAMWIGIQASAAIAVLTITAAPLHAEDRACDGRPRSAAERAACRRQLERDWRAAVDQEKVAETESKQLEAAAAEAASDATRRDQPAKVAAASAARLDEAAKAAEAAAARRDTARDRRLAIDVALVDNGLATAYEANHCERPLTICLDRDGEPITVVSPREALPDEVRPGDKLTVIVLTTTPDADRKTEVHFEARKSLERTFADEPAKDGIELKNLTDHPEPARPLATFEPLAFPSDPVADDALDLTISVQRKPSGKDGGVDKQYVIRVNLGRSYYSVGFLVAASYRGDRRVLRDLGTTSDHAVDPGLALNIFPGGRERGVIGYARRPSSPARWLANNVGVQIGTDLDLTDPTDKLYAGVVFEPVAGLALVGGVTLRKVAVVPPAGALPALAADDGSAPTDKRYVTRGYVGITMTLDLIETITEFGTKLRNIKTP